MRVLIAAPLRQEPKILLEHLKSIDNLYIPEGVEVDRYYVVNDCPEAIRILKDRDIRYTVYDTKDEYKKVDGDHLWTNANLNKMHLLRNLCLAEAYEKKYDFMLSVDTDIVMHPMTLKALLEAKKHLVSEVFWTPSRMGTWPNAWMYDQMTTGDTSAWKEPGLYEVGGTGALFLISWQAINDRVTYAPIYNIKDALIGEDRHFCVRAACAGYKIYLDTHYPATHLYDEAAYLKYMEGKKKCSHL